MSPTATEGALLAVARRGDEAAFAELVGPHRAALHAHCRRMLREGDDADDAVQEALLRAWRALPRFEGRSSLRSWLYKIATNTCLSLIEKRQRVVQVEYDHACFEDPETMAGIDAYWEQREAAAAALRRAVELLPPVQRAALILRDVAGLSAAETAEVLATTIAAANSALQRARLRLENGEDPDQTEPGPHSDARGEPVEGLIAALARGDIEGVVGIVADTTAPAERAWSYSSVPAY